ncbi:XRE family transcriptional regulator [Streptomyces flaveolus]|jgi:transcriptional regulator with XRE-family HTH domain|uniref:XRE family transcriptional regulator n=1 Tax=Streptomyces flaveolus TaxID=67297 RepID=UPI00339F76F9
MRSPHRAEPADQAPTPCGPTATPETAGAFALAFREAVQRRGLSLDRVRERLAAQGISISLATLSYWQRGRSQPEQAHSLRAVDALETILGLPAGTLRSLIGPSRPRGRITGEAPGLDASRQVLGEQSHVELALGEEFPQFNDDLLPLSIHETVRIDEHRRCQAVTVEQVMRATRDGARRITVVHGDVTADSATVTAHYGRLGTVRRLPELRTVVADLEFGRPLVRDETALISYTLRYGRESAESLHYERRMRTQPFEYLLHVCFHPDALPTRCQRFFRERIDAPMRYERRVALDVSHTSHMLLHKCLPGAHGMSWEWPR